MINRKILFWAVLLLFPSLSASAYWVWSPETGKFVNPEGAVQDTAEEQYEYAMEFYKAKQLDQAEDELKALLKKYPNARIAAEAQYRLGNIYEEKADFLKAFHAYKVVVESYPQSERFNEVIEREFRIGNVFLSGKKGKLMGLEILPSQPRAIEAFEHIVKYAPYSEFGDQAQFHLGIAQKKAGQFENAVKSFQNLIDQYPKSELVAQARFQLAETSYERSSTEFRDQRALDEASTQVDRFLNRYPDSTATEKAAKLRQVIDEKNAEKNYRIGLYYEKENYVDSALIYYSDAAKRYPDTHWGQKAAEKIKALKEPVKFASEQEQKLEEEIKAAEVQLSEIADKKSLEYEQAERKLERLKKSRKTLDHDKKDSLKRRREDLERRQSELKEKFKNLEKKKKLQAKNPSDDFAKAMERWHASLVAEQDALDQERVQIKDWNQTMGIEEHKVNLDFLPFMGEPLTEMEKVRQIEAKKLYKVSEEKKALLEEKELLYKQRGEVDAMLQKMEEKLAVTVPAANTGWLPATSGEPMPVQNMQSLDASKQQIDQMEKDLHAQKEAYEAHYGKSNWDALIKTPTQWVNKSAGIVAKSTGAVTKSLDKSFDALNPFDGKDENVQTLLEKRMHLQEKIATQQNLIDTLSHAFDAELALKEQKRILQSMEDGSGKADPRELRKSIKQVERQIRASYREIEDRHNHKKQLVNELEDLTKQHDQEAGPINRVGKSIAAPAVVGGKAIKAFLFGLPDKAVEVTETAAKQIPSDEASDVSERAQELEKDIEFESLMIEAKDREIVKLQRELEMLRAKGALSGGYKFRSSMVKVPYVFLGEAIESARKLVPKKEREEVLISRLNEETSRLEEYKSELTQVETRIDQLTPESEKEKAKRPGRRRIKEIIGLEGDALGDSPMAPPTAVSTKVGEDSVLPALPSEAELKEEIEKMAQQLKAEKEAFETQKSLEPSSENIGKEEAEMTEAPEIQESNPKQLKKEHKKIMKKSKKLRGELDEIQGSLAKIVRKENELEEKEISVLEKRIEHIDRIMPKLQSKAVSQDLLNERGHIETRIKQLTTRRDFLQKEAERFTTTDQPIPQAA